MFAFLLDAAWFIRLLAIVESASSFPSGLHSPFGFVCDGCRLFCMLCLHLGRAVSVGAIERLDHVIVGPFDGSIFASGLRACFVCSCWVRDSIGWGRCLFIPLGKSMLSRRSVRTDHCNAVVGPCFPFGPACRRLFGLPLRSALHVGWSWCEALDTVVARGEGLWRAGRWFSYFLPVCAGWYCFCAGWYFFCVGSPLLHMVPSFALAAVPRPICF